MKSLVIVREEPAMEEPFGPPRIYTNEHFERIVALSVEQIAPADDDEEERERLYWYVAQPGRGILGPIGAEVLQDGEWRAVEVQEVVACLAEHGITALTAWTESCKLVRASRSYYYNYTVEGNGLLDREACDWIEADIQRHCEAHEPRAEVAERYQIFPESELFCGGDAWRSAVLVHEGASYKIWLRIHEGEG